MLSVAISISHLLIFAVHMGLAQSSLLSPQHCLFDYLVRPREKVGRKCQTDLFCCLEIYDELKLRCLLHWQIGRLCALQDLVHINSRAPVEIVVVHPVRHETTLIDKLTLKIDSRKPVFSGKLDDPLPFGEKLASG